MEELGARVVGVALVGIGGWFVHQNRSSREMLQRSQYWPSVKGEVLQSHVKRHGGKNTTYEARITYRYQVAGRDFTSQSVTIGNQLQAGRKRAQARCDRYPVGSTPEVFYDPADPKSACLERVHEGALFEMGGALVAFGVGLAMLLGLIPIS